MELIVEDLADVTRIENDMESFTQVNSAGSGYWLWLVTKQE